MFISSIKVIYSHLRRVFKKDKLRINKGYNFACKYCNETVYEGDKYYTDSVCGRKKCISAYKLYKLKE